jgi:predicted PolB exonuclease-like 3'-5' exonuclease
MLNLKLDKILFLDIETVPQTFDYSSLEEETKHLWEDKFKYIKSRYSDNATPEYGYLNGGGIYAEFGKIVCISVGFVFQKNGERCFRTKSFAGDDEKKILSDFSSMLEQYFSTHEHNLCGHNIKEFDIPYICRRLLINGLPIPKTLRIAGKKPWEVNFIDTLELWKFGDYKNYTSLKLLTHIFGIPSPKDDIDGSQVAQVYYEEKNIERIVFYCEKDVLATTQLLLKMCGEELLDTEKIERASPVL